MRTVTALFLLGITNSALAFWRLPCDGPLVTERVDPLVSPGGVASHVHHVVGASNFGPSVSFDKLRQSTCTTCKVREDLSSYWTPNLYMAFANGTFLEVSPVGGLLA
jgi:hypothetical protein